MRIIFYLILVISLASCSCDCDNAEDIVIIGGGLMGSSAAWQLSDNGQKVVLLEQQDSIYSFGSSYGEARIARSSNRGDDIWSFLHNKSVSEVENLVSFLNEKTDSEHSMKDVYTTNPVTYVGRSRIYEKLYTSLIRQKVVYDMASTPEEAKDTYGVILPDSVLIQREYNAHSGMINPKALISKLHQAILLKDNDVRYNNQVLSVEDKGCFYQLEIENNKTGERQKMAAKRIISAAGPYTGDLLSEVAPYFKKLINPQRVFLAFLKIKGESYHNLKTDQKEKLNSFYPVINSSKGTRMGSFFSMIEYFEDGVPVIKIGGHFQRSPINNINEVWKQKLSESEIEWSISSTKRYFDLLNLPLQIEDIELVDQYSCVYSLTETEVPFITPIIGNDNEANPNFIVMGGMSGVGAKGAMAYGLLASDLLINNSDAEDKMYDEVKSRLGYNRLIKDVESIRKKEK